MNNRVALRVVFTFAAALTLLAALACGTAHVERIRQANEAAESGIPAERSEDAALSAEINAFDVRVGDCIASGLDAGVSTENVVIVPCEGEWEYRVTASFTVPDADDYPGEAYFLSQAVSTCDPQPSFVLHPTTDSWEQGDRIVNCMQAGFRISFIDPGG